MLQLYQENHLVPEVLSFEQRDEKLVKSVSDKLVSYRSRSLDLEGVSR